MDELSQEDEDSDRRALIATREYTIYEQSAQEELEEGEIIKEMLKEELLQYYIINRVKIAEELLAKERKTYDQVQQTPKELYYLAYQEDILISLKLQVYILREAIKTQVK